MGPWEQEGTAVTHFGRASWLCHMHRVDTGFCATCYFFGRLDDGDLLLATFYHSINYLFGITAKIILGSDKLISSSFDYSLKIWDTSRGELLHRLEDNC